MPYPKKTRRYAKRKFMRKYKRTVQRSFTTTQNRPELKQFLECNTGNPIPTGIIFPLAAIPQGTTNSTRIGNKVAIKMIRLNIHALSQAASTTFTTSQGAIAFNIVRIRGVVVGATTAQFTSEYFYNTGDPTTIVPYLARSKLVKRRIWNYTLSVAHDEAAGTDYQPATSKDFTIIIKPKGKNQIITWRTATPTDFSNNSMWLWVGQNVGAAASGISYTQTTYFTDC